MSHDENWIVYINQLVKSTKEGKTAVYNQIKELVDSGYVIRMNLREVSDDGRKLFSGIRYFFLEEKPTNDELLAIKQSLVEKFPNSCFLDTETPDTVNPPLRRLMDKKNNPKKTKDLPPLTPPKQPESSAASPDAAAREEEDFSSKEKIIEDLDIKPGQKKQLLVWELSELERAVRISKSIKPKQGLMNLLVHILRNPEKYEEPEEALTEQQRMALQHNEEIRHNFAPIAEENETLIRQELYMKAFRQDGILTTLSLKGLPRDLKEDLAASQAVLDEVQRRKQKGGS